LHRQAFPRHAPVDRHRDHLLWAGPPQYRRWASLESARATHVRPAIPHVLALAERGALRPERVNTTTVDWVDAADALSAGRWTKLVFSRT
ncbi:MAG TPA: hypothetical protein VG223_03305, partial [Solirubrobacteraceae bacterium]|nr:hypothetical protein [Solirubrobacteraceae bacterium]